MAAAGDDKHEEWLDVTRASGMLVRSVISRVCVTKTQRKKCSANEL